MNEILIICTLKIYKIWFQPVKAWSAYSFTCPNIFLCKILKPKLLSSTCIGVWILDRKHLNIENCSYEWMWMGEWGMFERSSRGKELYKNHLAFSQKFKLGKNFETINFYIKHTLCCAANINWCFKESPDAKCTVEAICPLCFDLICSWQSH